MAPIPKKPSGSTSKSGASMSGKNVGGKSGGLPSTGNKHAAVGSTSHKPSNFKSASSKTSNIKSASSKPSTVGATAIKTSAYGNLSPKKEPSSARTPSFLGGTPAGNVASGLAPSTSKKTYDTVSYSAKKEKATTSFGIIWIPGRKRNKRKDFVYSSINDDRDYERTPTMYDGMSGDSPDYQFHKKKEEESSLLLPEKVKGPIATAASAGVVPIITGVSSDFDVPTSDDKLLNLDKEETKEAAGEATNKEDTDYLENNDENIPENIQAKSADKVDSVYLNPSSGPKPPPPQSTSSNPDEEDCLIRCLHYTLQCCDCVLM